MSRTKGGPQWRKWITEYFKAHEGQEIPIAQVAAEAVPGMNRLHLATAMSQLAVGTKVIKPVPGLSRVRQGVYMYRRENVIALTPSGHTVNGNVLAIDKATSVIYELLPVGTLRDQM